MALTDELAEIEVQVKGRGLTIGQFCKRAEIARSTWDRWKRGETEPNTKTLRTVKSTLAALSGEVSELVTDHSKSPTPASIGDAA